jgi:Holliday junction resolvase-like predicted endonuclease
MVALYYLKASKQNNVKARFDVVSILSTEKNADIEIVKNAFELAYS